MSNRPQNNYELLKKSVETLVALKRTGYLKGETYRDLKMYEQFLSMDGTKNERYEKLGQEYRLHAGSVKRIIVNLSKYK